MALLVLAALAPGCTAAPATSPPLRLEATDLAEPMLADLMQADSGAKIEMAALPLPALNGDLALGRADLGLAATYAPGQFATPLGYVTFVVVVNPANPVSRLTVAQLRDIFAGRAEDWEQVGGAQGAIEVVSRESGSDAAAAFSNAALLGVAPALTALVAPDWAAMRQAVSENPAAIGYLPAPEGVASVKAVGLDVTLRALLVAVAPREPTGAARSFLAWAQSAAGQAVIARRYEAVR
jgi:phosphate transport system substrate-binding protein